MGIMIVIDLVLQPALYSEQDLDRQRVNTTLFTQQNVVQRSGKERRVSEMLIPLLPRYFFCSSYYQQEVSGLCGDFIDACEGNAPSEKQSFWVHSCQNGLPSRLQKVIKYYVWNEQIGAERVNWIFQKVIQYLEKNFWVSSLWLLIAYSIKT